MKLIKEVSNRIVKKLSKIIKLIEKNFKLIFRSKAFVLTVLLGPLLLSFLLGSAFNNSNEFTARIGVYSPNYDGEKQKILTNLENLFITTKFDSQEDCINSVKIYWTHTCVILPEEISVNNNELNEVVFYVDKSRINLVWQIIDGLSEFFSVSSQEISNRMTNSLLTKLQIVEDKSLVLEEEIQNVQEIEDAILIYVNEISDDLSAIDFSEIRIKVNESSVIKENSRELIVEKLDEIDNKIDSSQNILEELDELIVNNTNLTNKVTELEEKLINLENIVNQNDELTELDQLDDIFSEIEIELLILENEINMISNKNSEVENLLDSLRSNIEIVKIINQQINMTTSNLKITRPDKIAEPIRTRIEEVTTEETYLGYIFPTLVMIILVFVSILLPSSLLVMEKNDRAFFRNWLSKGNSLSFIISYFITCLMIVIVDILVFILLARFSFNFSINTGFLLLLALIAPVFILIGLILGTVNKNEQGTLLSGFIISCSLIFFSNTLVPIENAAGFMSKIISYNPLFIGEKMLRLIVMEGIVFSKMQHEILLMIIYIIILTLVLVITHHLTSNFPLKDKLLRLMRRYRGIRSRKKDLKKKNVVK